MSKNQELINYIVDEMSKRFVTRAELAKMLGTNDSSARQWLRANIKSEYPVICSTNCIGYKIATSPDDLELAKKSAYENHLKAYALHKTTNVLDHWIISTEAHEAVKAGKTIFNEEQINA